jgi:hypothetical protein
MEPYRTSRPDSRFLACLDGHSPNDESISSGVRVRETGSDRPNAKHDWNFDAKWATRQTIRRVVWHVPTPSCRNFCNKLISITTAQRDYSLCTRSLSNCAKNVRHRLTPRGGDLHALIMSRETWVSPPAAQRASPNESASLLRDAFGIPSLTLRRQLFGEQAVVLAFDNRVTLASALF